MMQNFLEKKTELSVSEFSHILKNMLENHFQQVRIRGEISGLKIAASGHIYFSLKDDKALINGICWRGIAGQMKVQLVDGMDVICTGQVTAYAGRSQYQIIAQRLEVAGEGALLKLLEERKRKLFSEGLFAPERKRPLPFLPEVIGIITSPTGAVIRDILHRLEDRFPRRILLWPVLVQGEDAARQVAGAIEGFNRLSEMGCQIQKPDLLIVARGGGSIEDLWSFNEEIVVRAAANSKIPLISAIGHETDTTLIDYASDRRAPTPTAAAEMAVPVRQELVRQVHQLDQRLSISLKNRYRDAYQRLDDWAERFNGIHRRFFDQRLQDLNSLIMRLRHPRQVIEQAQTRFSPFKENLLKGIHMVLEKHQMRLVLQAQLLESFSFHNTLKRGFCMVQTLSQKMVSSASDVNVDDNIIVTFQDGQRQAQIVKIP